MYKRQGWCGVVLVSGTPQPAICDAISSSRDMLRVANCHRQQHCLGGFCAAAARSDRARQGGPSHGLHLRPRPSVSRWPPRGGDSAFLLSRRLLWRVRCRRPLRLGLCIRESVHHRLAIQSDGAARRSSPALKASHRRRGFEANDLRHTVGGECHRQQRCLSGLGMAATRFDRARPGRPTHGLLRP